MQTVFDMAVDHSRTRVQFGRPIGRFQRVQDHIVRLVNHLDAARWTTYEALWKLDTGRAADTSIHMAKAVTSEAYVKACDAAHEVFGRHRHRQGLRTNPALPDVPDPLQLSRRPEGPQAQARRRSGPLTGRRLRQPCPHPRPKNQGPGLLSPYRVLDLAGENGILAGKILSDLGAEVIAIEPPDGSPVRRLGPFYKDDPHPERSLVWWAFAGGKRSVKLDITSELGGAKAERPHLRRRLPARRLCPGLYGQPRPRISRPAANKSVPRHGLHDSFRPDGSPIPGFLGPDLVGMALGGLTFLTGDPDRPPLRVTQPQFGPLTGASGAIGAMVAHYHRLTTGKGQHVDVSGQQAVARVLSEAPATWGLNHINVVRRGSYRGMGGERQLRTTWDAKDGFVSYFVMGGVLGERTNSLFRWMASEGFRPIPEAPADWREVDAGKLSEEVPQERRGCNGRILFSLTRSENSTRVLLIAASSCSP